MAEPNPLDLKNQGNTAYRRRDFAGAIGFYQQAIDLLQPTPGDIPSDDGEREMLGALYSNKCACLTFMENTEDALVAAESCIHVRPDWKKGYCRKISLLADIEDRKSEAVVMLFQFKRKFGELPPPPPSDDPTAPVPDPEPPFTKQELKWIEETEIKLNYYCWSPVIRDTFPTAGERLSEEEGAPPVVVVDIKGRGHYTSIFQASGSLPSGSTICVLNGEYNDIIYVCEKSNIEIIGQKPAWKTVINLTQRLTGVENIEQVNSCCLIAESRGIKIRNLKIKSSLNDREMISAVNVAEATVGFSNCTIECPAGVAVFAHNQSNIVLSKCRLRDSVWGYLNMGNECRLTIKNESLISMCKMGVCGREDINVMISDSEFRDCKEQGIIIMGKNHLPARIEMANSSVCECSTAPDSKSGMLVAGATHCLIQGCKFLSNGFQALHLKGSNCLIAGSEFGYSQMGIAVQCVSAVRLKNNVFRHHGFAIWITENENAKVVIEANEFEKNTVNVSKFPDEQDPTLIEQDGIEVIEYDNVVSSGNPQRRN